MKSNTHKSILIFFFQFVFWLGFTYVTRGDQEWKWLQNVLFSLGWATWMTYVNYQMMSNRELYLASGQGEGLKEYLKSQGYVEKKKSGDTTFFKKPGWSFNPFKSTAVKESAFYTHLVATQSIIENVPQHLERIRQPTV